MTPLSAVRIVGVLLAAGKGTRFGGDKLLAPLREAGGDVAAGTPVGVAACRHLVSALPETIAVVRPGDEALSAALARAGARIVECARADEGMGASLACGIAAAADAGGWVVALADMPWIPVSTIAGVAAAIEAGAIVAAPFVGDDRGHPVGFSRETRDALLVLRGDEGARDVVRRHAGAIARIESGHDRAVLRDVDTPADLA